MLIIACLGIKDCGNGFFDMKEIWKDIKGFEGYYQVSNLGRVKRCERLKINGHYKNINEMILKGTSDKDGYIVINLYKNSKYKGFKVHRLVAYHFLKNLKSKPQVNHKNLIKSDNRVENLEWCTNSENMQHARKHKKFNIDRKGAKNINSKLNDQIVYNIKKDLNKGLRVKDVAKKYNTTPNIITKIKNKKTWNHIKLSL